MPHIKREEPFVKLSRCIKGYGNAPKLAAAIGCSEVTARVRLEHPETFRLEELKLASQRMHIPWDELKGAINL